MYQGHKEDLQKAVSMIKTKIEDSEYFAAIGTLYYEKEDNLTFAESMKKAEELMYLDKERHYEESGHNSKKIN